MDKNIKSDLKNKAVNIKGKQYVLVSDRVVAFNEMFPEGSIRTEFICLPMLPNTLIAVAKVYKKEGVTPFTGHSQIDLSKIKSNDFVNQTSALENCETSAVGRALAMMGIGVIDSIASVDEINLANNKVAQPERVDVSKAVDTCLEKLTENPQNEKAEQQIKFIQDHGDEEQKKRLQIMSEDFSEL